MSEIDTWTTREVLIFIFGAALVLMECIEVAITIRRRRLEDEALREEAAESLRMVRAAMLDDIAERERSEQLSHLRCSQLRSLSAVPTEDRPLREDLSVSSALRVPAAGYQHPQRWWGLCGCFCRSFSCFSFRPDGPRNRARGWTVRTYLGHQSEVHQIFLGISRRNRGRESRDSI